MKRIPLLIVLLLIPALACSTTSFTESLVPSGNVLYQDIFSSPQSGWGELTSPAGTANYTNGAYHFIVSGANVNLWSHPGMDFSAVHMEVAAMSASSLQDSRMGLICRLKDDKNFYFFIISADGYYGIGKMKNGQTALLTGDQMLPNNSILTGNQINHMRADCISNSLILYVNNALVGAVKDSDFVSGDVGVLAGTFNQPGADVYFDNFVVYKP